MPDSARVLELKTALTGVLKDLDEGLSGPGVKIDGQNVDIDPKIFDLRDQAEEIKGLIQTEMFGVETKAWMENPSGPSAAMQANNFNGQHETKRAPGSLGEEFVTSTIFTEFQKTGRLTMDNPYVINRRDVTAEGTMEQKDIYGGLLTGALNPRGFGAVQFDGMVPRAQRPTRVRDLFPVATTNSNLIDYFRVLGFAENGGDGNAKTVAQRMAANGTDNATGGPTDVFGLKPKSSLTFQSAQAPVRTIAHWEAAHRNVLKDEPQLQSTINNELLYGLALEEDDQILNGDGVNENLLGILRTVGIQGYTQSDDGGTPVIYEPKSDALRRAQTKAIIANYPPTGYVLHPNDWEDVELQKDGQGRYMLVSSISVGAESRVWRLPVVESPAMPEGTFLTGAFGIGAQLYDREIANVRIAEQHADFFVRNAVAILVEEQLALAVKRPESFVKGTFTN